MTKPSPTPAAVLRVIKLQTFAKLASSAAHTWRTQPVPHADPERAHLNEDWRPVSSPEGLRAVVKARLALADRRPRNAVVCLEYLVTAPREAFTQFGGRTSAAAYFRDACAFIEERHGAENLVAVNIQHDESAPHLVAYVVPLVERPAGTVKRSVFVAGKGPDGKQRREVKVFPVPARTVLSADHYMGSPDKLRRLQTEFAERVGGRHGLRRGLERSAATHTTNRDYHAALARAFASHLSLTPDDLGRRGHLLRRESLEEVADRLSELVRENYAPVIASAATAAHDRRRAREMVETARRAQEAEKAERLAHEGTRKRLSALSEGLSPGQVKKIEAYVAKCREANAQRLREREAQKRQVAQEQEDTLAAQLKTITPERLAMMPTADRQQCWRLMFARVDLAETVDRMAASGYFEAGGQLSPQGQALSAPAGRLENYPPTEPCSVAPPLEK